MMWNETVSERHHWMICLLLVNSPFHFGSPKTIFYGKSKGVCHQREERDQTFLVYYPMKIAWARGTFCLEERWLGLACWEWGGKAVVTISKYQMVFWELGDDVLCGPDKRTLANRSKLPWGISQLNLLQLIAPEWLFGSSKYSFTDVWKLRLGEHWTIKQWVKKSPHLVGRPTRCNSR